MQCKNCNNHIPVETIQICPNCGKKEFIATTSKPPKRKFKQKKTSSMLQKARQNLANPKQIDADKCFVPLNIQTNGKESLRYPVSMPYANIIQRITASFIDYLLFVIIFVLSLQTIHIDLFILLIAFFCYQVFMESSSYQATIGKKILKIYVYDDNGKRLTLLRAITRNIFKKISLIFPPLLLIVIFAKRYKSLHDLIAKTSVLYIPE